MKLIFPVLIVSLLAAACNGQMSDVKGGVLVRVGDKELSEAEVVESLPGGLTQEDSLIISENYIRKWINDRLMYEIASKNVTDMDNIDQLVGNYRKSLVVYQYQEQLINEKLSKEISKEEMMQYYEANSEKFILDQTLIKGLFLKIPSDAPQISKVGEWCKSASPSSIEQIEKYSVQNAVVYDYFFDHWVDFNELVDNLPVDYRDPDAVVKSNKYIALQDSSFCYFLNIRQYLLQGDNAPFEYAQSAIKEILINQRKMDFMKGVEEDLYQSALNKGKIEFYTK